MNYNKSVLGQQQGAYVFKTPPLVIPNYSLADVSAGTVLSGGTFGGPYKYFRFQGTDGSDNLSGTPQAINEIDFIDDSNNNHPTHFSNNSGNNTPDAGGTDKEGPYTNSAVTISAGYSHSKTYGPFRPFDGHLTNAWRTIGNTNANINYLDVDFTPTNTNGLNISQIQIKVHDTWHDCLSLRVMASNSSDFSSYSTFGIINYVSLSNITDLGSTTLNLNVGKILTVGAGASTTETDITYPGSANDYTRGVVTQNTNTYMSGNYMRGSSRLYDKLI